MFAVIFPMTYLLQFIHMLRFDALVFSRHFCRCAFIALNSTRVFPHAIFVDALVLLILLGVGLVPSPGLGGVGLPAGFGSGLLWNLGVFHNASFRTFWKR